MPIYLPNDPLPKLPTVPETLLKRRKSARRDTFRENLSVLTQKRKSARERSSRFKRPASFIQAENKVTRDTSRLERMKSKKLFYIPDESKVALVVRVTGRDGIHEKAKKVLSLLRLGSIHEAVFVKMNQPMLNLLTVIDPYVVWGYPTLKTVKDLVYKRGQARLEGKKKAITDNKLIEDNLDKYGMLCVEDIIHEIITVGPHFKQVMEFFWPFKLSRPTGAWRKPKSSIPQTSGGNRYEQINELVARMI